MEATVLRDGLTLRGFYDVPAGKPAFDCAIIFHGFTGNCGRQKERVEYQTAQTLLNAGMAVARFDFNGHGKSDGRFEDMTVLNELDDARAILRFVRQQPGVQRIMLVGMSQGGVVASMLAGYYHDVIDQVVLMYPAATLKDDAQHGEMQGLHYDPQQIPAVQVWHSDHGDFSVGDFYFRTAQTLPIYEVAKQYRGNGRLRTDSLLVNICVIDFRCFEVANDLNGFCFGQHLAEAPTVSRFDMFTL